MATISGNSRSVPDMGFGFIGGLVWFLSRSSPDRPQDYSAHRSANGALSPLSPYRRVSTAADAYGLLPLATGSGRCTHYAAHFYGLLRRL